MSLQGKKIGVMFYLFGALFLILGLFLLASAGSVSAQTGTTGTATMDATGTAMAVNCPPTVDLTATAVPGMEATATAVMNDCMALTQTATAMVPTSAVGGVVGTPSATSVGGGMATSAATSTTAATATTAAAATTVATATTAATSTTVGGVGGVSGTPTAVGTLGAPGGVATSTALVPVTGEDLSTAAEIAAAQTRMYLNLGIVSLGVFLLVLGILIKTGKR